MFFTRSVSVVVKSALVSPRELWHTQQCPCISVVPDATYKARLRTLEEQRVNSKGPSRVRGLDESFVGKSVYRKLLSNFLLIAASQKLNKMFILSYSVLHWDGDAVLLQRRRWRHVLSFTMELDQSFRGLLQQMEGNPKTPNGRHHVRSGWLESGQQHHS